MTKDTKKSTGWFKGVLTNQNLIDELPSEESEAGESLKEETIEVEKPVDSEAPKHLFSKDNQDKVSLDMIVALENMFKDRQLILYRNSGLEEHLSSAKDMIVRLKDEVAKKELLLKEKINEVNNLDSKLTNKQMSYDQLLEDYKEYQNNSNKEFEKISGQLEKETNKYNKLNDESTNNQYQSMLKVKELEEKVRNLEVENQKYVEQYEKIVDEKNELMKTINDFTERMSFSFSPKNNTNTPK